MRNQDNTKNAGFQDSSPPSALPKGKNYLLSIGIDKYTDLPPLFNAVKDAQEVVEVLLNKYQFEQTLVMELYNDTATKKNIYKKLRELTQRVTPKDNVLIYFSGHGEYDKIAKEGYWIPVDAENGEESDYIPNTVIRKKLGTINSRHTFLMADSCFAGSLFAKSAGRNVGKRYERDPSRWGLTAGRNEIVSDGKAGDNSPFAESLLYRLRNNTGALNVQELCAHVTEYVLANSKQTPIGEPLQIEGHKNGQFVFHMKKDEVADWKTAVATGTLGGYELFLLKYPDGEYATEAKTEVNNQKANQSWTNIQAMPDETTDQVRTKLQRIHHFLKTYPNAIASSDAEDLGELLQDKTGFLKNYDNLFSLRKFARKDTPFKAAAEKRILELETKLEGGNKEPIEVVKPATKKATPKEKGSLTWEGIIDDGLKRADQRKKEKNKKKYDSIPSFFQKNIKYLLPLLLIPFLIWGIAQMFDSSTDTTNDSQTNGDPEEVILVSDNDTFAKENPVEIETSNSTTNDEKTQPEIENPQTTPPLDFSYRWGNNEIKATIKGGKAPYQIRLEKNGKEKYKNKITVEGQHNIIITKAFREDAGMYQLFLKDNNGQTSIKNLKIDEPRPIINYGSFTDSRDGQIYEWVRLKDGKIWMVENLNFKTISGSYCYEENKKNCRKYGRLYKWDTVIKACPKGWKLPGSGEWEDLIKLYGGGEVAVKALVTKSNNRFLNLFAGGQLLSDDGGGYTFDPEYTGFYWTATEDNSKAKNIFFNNKYDYNIDSNDKMAAFSCKCIRKEN